MVRQVQYWLVRSAWLIACAALMLLLGTTQAHAQSGITSPAPGSALSGDVPVMGTATIDPFQKYELHYKLEPSGDDAFVYFDGGTAEVINGQLGIWRAAGLPPGIYTLRLRVVKQDGNYAETLAPNLSVNQGPAGTPTPDLSATPTITPTSSVPTPTFTPAPSPTPAIGAVVQPQLGQDAAAPTPIPAPDVNAAQPATDLAAAPVVVQPGDLAPSQPSAAANEQATPATSATRRIGRGTLHQQAARPALSGHALQCGALSAGAGRLWGQARLQLGAPPLRINGRLRRAGAKTQGNGWREQNSRGIGSSCSCTSLGTFTPCSAPLRF